MDLQELPVKDAPKTNKNAYVSYKIFYTKLKCLRQKIRVTPMTDGVSE